MKERVHHSKINFGALMVVIMLCALSCTKPGNVVLPAFELRLVLHGYVEVGDTFRIALGKAMPQKMLHPGDSTFVTNGWAALFENNVFLDSLKYNAVQKRYVSAHILAVSGKTYKVKAGAPGFPDVEAVATAPFPVPLTSLTRVKATRRTSGGTLLDDVKFSFNDPAPQSNFYLAAIYGPANSSCVYTYDPAIERHSLNLVPFEQGDCIDNDELLYTDRSFNGQLKEITLSVWTNALDSFVHPITGAVYRPYFRKFHITEEYYRYFKTAINQDQIFEEGPMLADPRTAKGNVKNGYGLFTVFAAVTDTIR